MSHKHEAPKVPAEKVYKAAWGRYQEATAAAEKVYQKATAAAEKVYREATAVKERKCT
jgi:hypothetical protein